MLNTAEKGRLNPANNLPLEVIQIQKNVISVNAIDGETVFPRLIPGTPKSSGRVICKRMSNEHAIVSMLRVRLDFDFSDWFDRTAVLILRLLLLVDYGLDHALSTRR